MGKLGNILWTAFKIFWIITGIFLMVLVSLVVLSNFNAPQPDLDSVHGIIPKIMAITLGSIVVYSAISIIFFGALIVFIFYLLVTLIVVLVRLIFGRRRKSSK